MAHGIGLLRETLSNARVGTLMRVAPREQLLQAFTDGGDCHWDDRMLELCNKEVVIAWDDALDSTTKVRWDNNLGSCWLPTVVLLPAEEGAEQVELDDAVDVIV